MDGLMVQGKKNPPQAKPAEENTILGLIQKNPLS
jgi:hypothetical protein